MSTTVVWMDDVSFYQSNKPAMERRRRERMNAAIRVLKGLVLKAQGKDVSAAMCFIDDYY